MTTALNADGIAGRAQRRFSAALVAEWAFWLMGLACSLYLLQLGRRTTFFYDEWSWIQQRRGWSPGNFLRNHNGHCSVVPVFVYHLLFATAGLRAYLPYRLVLMVVHVLTAYSLYRYGRSRVGPLFSLIPAGMILLVGVAWQDLLWPFQIGFLGALGLGVASLVLLDGPCRKSRDILASACLLGAVTCSGVGLPLLAGAAVRCALRRQWRRWWVVAVPALTYAAWFARYGLSQHRRGSSHQIITYFGDSYRAAAGALTGHDAQHWQEFAFILGMLLLAGALARIISLIRRGQSVADLAAVVVASALLWALTAVTRAQYHDYGASRYLYLDAFLLLTGILELLRGVQLAPTIARRIVGTGLTVAAVSSTWTGLTDLHHGKDGLQSTSSYVRADLAALEHSQPNAGYHPDPARIPVLTAGGFLAARRALGSPALAWSAIERQDPGVRHQIDEVLLQAGGNLVYTSTIAPPAPEKGPAPALGSLTDARTRTAGSCTTLTPTIGPLTAIVRVRLDPLILHTKGLTHILSRRFGPFMIGLLNQQAGQTARITAINDGSLTPWTIEIGTADPVTLCD